MKKVLAKKFQAVLACILILVQVLSATTFAYPSGTIQDTISEEQMLSEILDALAEHTKYSETQFHTYETIPGSGYFYDGRSSEYGIRTHNHYVLLYAFLYKELPDEKLGKLAPSVKSREALKQRAIQAITYSVNTHKTIDMYNCPDGGKWGLVWQSAMWTGKLAIACHMMWDEIDTDLKSKLERIVISEADLIASNADALPTEFRGDTRAEENGWDTNIVALASSMFPDHPNAGQWDYAAKKYAMNTLSVRDDALDSTIVDGDMVRNWYVGANLYDDFSLENHYLFHPVYQMATLLEIADSVLYYKMFGKPIPKAFDHHVKDNFDEVLKKLVLPTGAWAWPNGTDWSIDSLDQIGVFAFMSTYHKDVEAKLVEQRAWQFIRERQKLYGDGRFIGPKSDTGARRESIQVERIIVTYLLHKYFGDWPQENTTWDDMVANNSGSGTFIDGCVVYDKNPKRFTSFSWANNKIMAIFVPDSNEYLDEGFVNFPYLKSFTGQFKVKGDSSSNQNHNKYKHNSLILDKGFTTTGQLYENSGNALNHYISFTALPRNGVVYMDEVKAEKDLIIEKEEGIPLGFRTDEISGKNRTLYYEGGHQVSDGKTEVFIPGDWVNVDGQVGMLVRGGQGIRYGDWTDSVNVAQSAAFSRLYGSYTTAEKSYKKGDIVASRDAVVYSNIDKNKTKDLNNKIVYPQNITKQWRVIVVSDADDKKYLIAANFNSWSSCSMSLSLPEGAPVLLADSVITGNTIAGKVANEGILKTQVIDLYAYVITPEGKSVNAIQNRAGGIHIKNSQSEDINITISLRKKDGTFVTQQKLVPAGKSYSADLSGNDIIMSEIAQYGYFPNPFENASAELLENSDSIKLTWIANPEQLSVMQSEGIKIERRAFSSNWTTIAVVDGNSIEYIDYDIKPGRTYEYRLSIAGQSIYNTSGWISSNFFIENDGRINIARGKPVTCINTKYKDVTNVDEHQFLWKLTDGYADQKDGKITR